MTFQFRNAAAGEELDAAVRKYMAAVETDTGEPTRLITEWSLVIATQRIDEDNDIVDGYAVIPSNGAMLHTARGLLAQGMDELDMMDAGDDS